METIFSVCSNICSLLSCFGDIRNAVQKLCPCMREKTEPPLIHEEKKKINLFGKTVVELNTIEENISQD